MAEKAKDPRQLYLKGVRLSYPHLLKRQKANEDADPKFSASFLIDPGTKQGKKNLAMIEVAIEAAKKEAKFSPKVKFKEGRKCLFDGDENTDDEGNVKAGYEGMMFIKASNKDAFDLRLRSRKPIDPENSPFYGGCIVDCKLGVYGTPKGGSPGIFASLDGILFREDGEAFGRAAIGEDDWDDDDDDDDDMADDDDDLLG